MQEWIASFLVVAQNMSQVLQQTTNNKHSRFRSITHQSEWALPPWDHRALLVAQYVPTLQYTFEP